MIEYFSGAIPRAKSDCSAYLNPGELSHLSGMTDIKTVCTHLVNTALAELSMGASFEDAKQLLKRLLDIPLLGSYAPEYCQKLEAIYQEEDPKRFQKRLHQLSEQHRILADICSRKGSIMEEVKDVLKGAGATVFHPKLNPELEVLSAALSNLNRVHYRRTSTEHLTAQIHKALHELRTKVQQLSA